MTKFKKFIRTFWPLLTLPVAYALLLSPLAGPWWPRFTAALVDGAVLVWVSYQFGRYRYRKSFGGMLYGLEQKLKEIEQAGGGEGTITYGIRTAKPGEELGDPPTDSIQ